MTLQTPQQYKHDVYGVASAITGVFGVLQKN